MIRPGLIGLTLLSSLALAQGGGFLEAYHPAPNAPRLPVRECSNTKPAENSSVFTCKAAKVIWDGALDFTLSDPNRTVRLEVNAKQIPIRLETMPMFLSEVFEGDLNQDGRQDYAIKLGWGGNGIIGDGNVTVFALSNSGGHTLTAIDTLTFDKNALVRQNGKPQMLHVSLVSANGTDGRNHTYFVYTPLEIRGDSLVAGLARTWIQYTRNPNHMPAKNLTKSEKARAWASEQREIFINLR